MRRTKIACSKTSTWVNCIDGLVAYQFALEAQFEITDSLKVAHRLADLENGSAVTDGEHLVLGRLRPDIIQIRPSTGEPRRVITPSGRLEQIGPDDGRLGLRIIDIKIAGEPSPAHFSELAYYGMALAGLDRRHRACEPLRCPGQLLPSGLVHTTVPRCRSLDREDRANNLPQRDLHRYLEGLEADLEAMPPEVVLGRVQRFLTVDLREVLAEADWRQLAWHIDHRCSGCDYLGYRWSRHDDEAAEREPDRGPAPDERYCWPMAEQSDHLSRVAGLTEGACGKLREANVGNVRAVSALPAGSPAFERHQTLRAKRTVLSARATTLRDASPAVIPVRAGTSAVLPKFADIRVAVSADFDVGSGLTFALGYRINYGIPNALRPQGAHGPRFGREFHTIERPLLVPDRSLDAEGETLRVWLRHLVTDIVRIQNDILTGYRAHGVPDKADVTLQFFLWDRLIYDQSLSRVWKAPGSAPHTGPHRNDESQPDGLGVSV